jgi:glutamate synthase (NADPH/NADH) large chain
VNDLRIGLYDPARESSACGVGFITRKDGRQDHDVIVRGEHALCAIPPDAPQSIHGRGSGRPNPPGGRRIRPRTGFGTQSW